MKCSRGSVAPQSESVKGAGQVDNWYGTQSKLLAQGSPRLRGPEALLEVCPRSLPPAFMTSP